MVFANVFYFLGPLHRNVNHCYNIWSTMFISYLSRLTQRYAVPTGVASTWTTDTAAFVTGAGSWTSRPSASHTAWTTERGLAGTRWWRTMKEGSPNARQTSPSPLSRQSAAVQPTSWLQLGGHLVRSKSSCWQ